MWINPTTLQVFTTHSEIRSAFTNVSFPSVMTEEDIAFVGLAPVAPTPQPVFDRRTQRVDEAEPLLIADQWTQQWAVVTLTAQEAQVAAEQIQQEIVAATQARLDAFAQTRNYDDIKSASDYAGCSVPKFSVEGTYCRDARAETWAALYVMLDEVQAGTRPMPSGYVDIKSELPTLAWPQV